MKEYDYVISMMVQTSINEKPTLKFLGFTGFDDVISPVCNLGDSDVWVFKSISDAQFIWDRYKDRLKKRWGKMIDWDTVYISMVTMSIDKKVKVEV